MTTENWYRLLLENHVTHTVDKSGVRQIIPCRVENPNLDLERIWNVATTPGLTSELKSFCWIMLHNLLPTKTRLYRIGLSESPNCDQCDDASPDTLTHSLLTCPCIGAAGSYLLSVLMVELPSILPEQVVLLDFDVSENLPYSYLSATVLSEIWKCRKEKRVCSAHIIRATLEAGIQILRKTRFKNSAEKLQAVVDVAL